MDHDGNAHIGSPSPPYEGVIIEEAEKQLESGDFEMNGDVDEVNILSGFTTLAKFYKYIQNS